MPRPKKIAQEEVVISEVVEVQEELVIEAEEELIIEPVSMTVPQLEVSTIEVVASKTIYKVYHLGNFVVDVEENSNALNGFLDNNRVQLYDNIDKLKTVTTDPEDLVLFNVPPTDNRKYNSLSQFYQQNGLAPQAPRITDWMTYYKFKYPLATEEEIAIQVFGPLDFTSLVLGTSFSKLSINALKKSAIISVPSLLSTILLSLSIQNLFVTYLITNQKIPFQVALFQRH